MSSDVLDTAHDGVVSRARRRERIRHVGFRAHGRPVALVVVLHISIPGSIPSGADGGNWLAIARGLLGEDVMASDVAYPADISRGSWRSACRFSMQFVPCSSRRSLQRRLLVLAVYICCRPLGRWYSAGAVVCCGVAGAQLEAYAWGGYPQLMGTAFALLAVYFAVRWLNLDGRGNLILCLALGALTFASHALVGGLLLVAMPLALVHWLLNARRGRREILRAVAIGTCGSSFQEDCLSC